MSVGSRAYLANVCVDGSTRLETLNGLGHLGEGAEGERADLGWRDVERSRGMDWWCPIADPSSAKQLEELRHPCFQLDQTVALKRPPPVTRASTPLLPVPRRRAGVDA